MKDPTNDNVLDIATRSPVKAPDQPRPCLTCGHRVGLRALPSAWWCGMRGTTCRAERLDGDAVGRSCGVAGGWWTPRPPSLGDHLAAWAADKVRT
jgi:hypothetical protein